MLRTASERAWTEAAAAFASEATALSNTIRKIARARREDGRRNGHHLGDAPRSRAIWLIGAGGERYTSELRFVAVDPAGDG